MNPQERIVNYWWLVQALIPGQGGFPLFKSNGLLDSALDGVVFIRKYFHIVWVDVVTRCLPMLENGRSNTGLEFFDPGTKGLGSLATHYKMIN